MSLAGFQYETVNLDVNKVCSEEKQEEKSRKSQNVTEWCRYGKLDVIHTNVEYLSCGIVEGLGYFQLSNMSCIDRNVVAERVSTTVLQLYLI